MLEASRPRSRDSYKKSLGSAKQGIHTDYYSYLIPTCEKINVTFSLFTPNNL